VPVATIFSWNYLMFADITVRMETPPRIPGVGVADDQVVAPETWKFGNKYV
jgi:hypothetical protein